MISNQGQTVPYRCDVCKNIGEAKQQLQIKTDESSFFFIVYLTRVDENYENQVRACDDIRLIDCDGIPRIYRPISVIHHRGGINSDSYYSRHYMADVRSKSDGSWYYTSDATIPKQISRDQVTKAGVVILYMRKS